MSRLTSKLLIGIGGLGIAGAAILGARYLERDAFAGYRFPKSDEDVGVRLYGVDLKVFEEGKLVTQADIDRVDVRRDRQFYELYGVQGKSGGSSKVDINFASDRAIYDTIAKSLTFENGVSVKNADFDLFAPLLTIDERQGTVSSPTKVAGRAMGGKVAMANFRYGMKTREMVTGPIRFSGRLPGVVQDGVPIPQDRTKSTWDVDMGSTRQKGDLVIYTKIRATDGEVLVRAEQGEWNRKTDVMTCTGRVFFYGDKVNLVADKVVIYRKERRAVASGNVRMLIKPKDQPNIVEEIPPFRPEVPENIAANNPPPPTPNEVQQQKDLDDALRSPENVRKYPAIVVAEGIELSYAKGRRRATITGNPECLQDFPGGRWRRVKAGRALWDGQAETMRLEAGESRPVNLKTSIGDDLFSSLFIVSVKEGEDSPSDWEAPNGTRGKIARIEDEDVPPPTTGTTGTTGETGTTGTTGSTGGG